MDIPRHPDSPVRRWRWAGAAGLVALSVALAAIAKPAVPGVARAGIVTDTVVRGNLTREVRGPGTLVPEEQLQIPALASGRVEQRRVEPGAAVDSGDVLVVLANPELHLQLLDAERTLAAARLARQRLASAHELERLAVEQELSTLDGQQREARRQHEVAAALVDSQWVSANDAAAARERFEQMNAQVALARKRLTVSDSTYGVELAAQDEEINRLIEVAAFHRSRLASLTIRAEGAGTVQELPVEQGQWIMSGTMVSRVFRPGRLKAELRIPEARSGEVAPGQRAWVVIRGDSLAGVVRRVNPAASAGTVRVELSLIGKLPSTARPDVTVEGAIETGRLDDVLHLRRPAAAVPGQQVQLYRVAGDDAVRTTLRVGEGSSDRIAVLEGASPGEVFIVNDLPDVRGAARIRIR